MRREIVTVPAAILHAQALPVTEVNDSIKALVKELYAAMYAAKGLGLAAPQVGIPLRVAVMDIHNGKPLTLINPEVVDYGDGLQVLSREGCLSCPDAKGQYPTVPLHRYKTVTITGLHRSGRPYRKTLRGVQAIVAQHELDHLNGLLVVDRALSQAIPTPTFGTDTVGTHG